MERQRVPITMLATAEMDDDTKEAAWQARITQAEWVRRCVCFGMKNQDVIARTECCEKYRVSSRGRPPVE